MKKKKKEVHEQYYNVLFLDKQGLVTALIGDSNVGGINWLKGFL